MIDKRSRNLHNHPSVNDRPISTEPRPPSRPGGRPRKYAEPSQPITITLPNTTLKQLQQIDTDRGRAIVKLARDASWDTAPNRGSVEIVEFAENTGLVVVGPNHILGTIPFLQLVQVAPGRFLLALAPDNDFHQLEIALTDLLETAGQEGGVDAADSELISRLLKHLRNFRRSDSMTLAQIVLVRLDRQL
jgi:hypothetical protein